MNAVAEETGTGVKVAGAVDSGLGVSGPGINRGAIVGTTSIVVSRNVPRGAAFPAPAGGVLPSRSTYLLQGPSALAIIGGK